MATENTKSERSAILNELWFAFRALVDANRTQRTSRITDWVPCLRGRYMRGYLDAWSDAAYHAQRDTTSDLHHDHFFPFLRKGKIRRTAMAWMRDHPQAVTDCPRIDPPSTDESGESVGHPR